MSKFWFNILFLFLLLCSAVFLHEHIHGVIALQFGCSNVHYGFDWIGFYTSYDCSLSDSLFLAQSINEIVFYTFAPFLFCIVTILLFKGDS